MSISKDLNMRIRDGVASLNENFYIYKNDGGVELRLKLNFSKFGFDNISKNLVFDNGISFVDATILKPNQEVIKRDDVEMVDDTIIFCIDKSLADDIDDIGIHRVQFHLYDNEGNRLTTPPISFEVKELIGEIGEDFKIATVEKSHVDYCKVSKDTGEIDIFNDGKYIKTQWFSGDIITAEKLNKIEFMLENLDNRVNEISDTGLEIDKEYIDMAIAGEVNEARVYVDNRFIETRLYMDEEITKTNDIISDLKLNYKSSDEQILSETKIYTDTVIASLIDNAPETLNTLKELSDAIKNHEDEYDSLLEVIGGKVDISNVYSKNEVDEMKLILETYIESIDLEYKNMDSILNERLDTLEGIVTGGEGEGIQAILLDLKKVKEDVLANSDAINEYEEDIRNNTSNITKEIEDRLKGELVLEGKINIEKENVEKINLDLAILNSDIEKIREDISVNTDAIANEASKRNEDIENLDIRLNDVVENIENTNNNLNDKLSIVGSDLDKIKEDILINTNSISQEALNRQSDIDLLYKKINNDLPVVGFTEPSDRDEGHIWVEIIN